MTTPRFKVGERVCIPADKPVTDAFRRAKGTVIEVYPGTGPGTQFVGERERVQWSTRTEYLVDFGAAIGRQRIGEGLLESESN